MSQGRLIVGWLAPAVLVLLSSCGEQVVVRETQATCGNGSIEVGEACDDGNEANDDGCTNSCAMAICGDAAHPMMPNLGQGGCQATEDGYRLGEELATVSHTREVGGARRRRDGGRRTLRGASGGPESRRP